MSLKNTTLEEVCELYLQASNEKEKQRYSGSIFEELQALKGQAKRKLIGNQNANIFFFEEEFEEIFMDSVRTFIKKLDNTKGLKSFFYMIYVNKGKDLYRKEEKKRNATLSLNVVSGTNPKDSSKDSEHLLNKTALENHNSEQNDNSEFELNLILQLCCSFLNDKKREATYLHYYDEMTQKKVAEKLGVSYSSVKERCLVGKKQSRLFLENYKENRELYAVFDFTEKQKKAMLKSSFFDDTSLFECKNIDVVLEKSVLVLQKEEVYKLCKWLFKSNFFKATPYKIIEKWANALYFWKEKFYEKEYR